MGCPLQHFSGLFIWYTLLTKSQVSMYITQINPLENEDYEGEGSISWFGILPLKIQKFALNNLAMFPCKSHKSTPWKTGTLVVNGLSAKAQKRAQTI